jgi:hypothetical protein
MSGVTTSVGVLGAAAVLGRHAAKGQLPFTGVALGIYLAVGAGLILTGLVLRLVGAAGRK